MKADIDEIIADYEQVEASLAAILALALGLPARTSTLAMAHDLALHLRQVVADLEKTCKVGGVDHAGAAENYLSLVARLTMPPSNPVDRIACRCDVLHSLCSISFVRPCGECELGGVVCNSQAIVWLHEPALNPPSSDTYGAYLCEQHAISLYPSGLHAPTGVKVVGGWRTTNMDQARRWQLGQEAAPDGARDR
ncbi:MAG: hypothetical protein QUS11_04105 [Candidatus Fermentibacter sp.]|nr:hypothetical protein [Candidatus Fermentibacter sp.]